MAFYFLLQYRIFRRYIEETGLPFILGLLLLILLLVVLYVGAQSYPVYAPYVLVSILVSVLYQLGDPDRVDFLRHIFSKRVFYKVRCCENMFCSLPFMGISLSVGHWMFGVGMLLLAFLISFVPLRRSSTRAIPTPFRKYPFEFINLFRRLWWLAALIYVVVAISVYYNNANLSLVLFGVYILLLLGAYDILEQEYVVWNYAMSPESFLKHKVWRGCLQLTLCLCPLMFCLIIFYPAQIVWTTLCWGVGLLLLILTILMKYTAYPRRVGLIEAFTLMGVGMMPLLIVAIYPYFYKKAVRNLRRFL